VDEVLKNNKKYCPDPRHPRVRKYRPNNFDYVYTNGDGDIATPVKEDNLSISTEVINLFRDAQGLKGPRFDHRCMVCGACFENGECIECGHRKG